MSRTRYEPVPQLEEVIDLASLDQTYNYNTAVPTSPPPSFHSSQSNNVTPRPASVAPSAASEALIVNLHKRIEKLEETIGRLLLEKETKDSFSPDDVCGRDNCCVTFADPAQLSFAERTITRRGNCCVRFEPPAAKGERRTRFLAIVFAIIIMGFFFTVILTTVVGKGYKCEDCPALEGSD